MTGPISHVGIVTSIAPTLVTQAVEPKVATLTLADTLANARYAYALQPLELHDVERAQVCAYALSKVGEGYDTFDLALQALDVVFGTDWFTQHGAANNEFICSELVSQAYAQVGRAFGVPSRSATPTEIFNFCLTHMISYAVLPLK